MKWINTNGGPLICSSKKSAKYRKGIIGSSFNTRETDYERACAIYDYIDIITSGEDNVMVLGDEPMRSKIFENEKLIFIARWEYCKSQELADNALKNLPEDLDCIADDKFIKLPKGELILFDSAFSFNEVKTDTCSSVEEGVYRITTESYKSAKEYSFIIHRLIKSS